MRGVQSFLEDSLPAMVDYILVVSTTSPHDNPASASEESRERHKAAKVLQERVEAMPALYRESIPLLPYLLDIPRHLAVITSAVLRYSRESPSLHHPPLEEFLSCCIDIEQQALFRVSSLVERGGMDQVPPSSQSNYMGLPLTPYISGDQTPSRLRKPSHSSRPMTAPPVTSDSADSREIITEPRFPPGHNLVHSRGQSSSQVNVSGGSISPIDQALEGGSWPIRKRLPPSHPRSISTDSIPAFNKARIVPPSDGPSSPTIAAHSHEEQDSGRRKNKGILRGLLVRK